MDVCNIAVAPLRVLRASDLSVCEGTQLERSRRTMRSGACLQSHSSLENPQRPRLLPVPDVLQRRDYHCGPASLRAILGYFNKQHPTESVLARALRTSSESGTHLGAFVDVAARYGLRATLRRDMTLDALAGFLAQKSPVVVNYQAWRDPTDMPWKDNSGDGHYAVVIGMDAKNVYLEDPWIINGIDTIPRDEFLQRWHGDESLDGKPAVQCGIVFHHA